MNGATQVSKCSDCAARRHLPWLAVLAILGVWVFWPGPVGAADPAAVNIEAGKEAVTFTAGRDVIGKYHIGPGAAKPYLWPLYAPGNVPVTRAWPMQEAKEGETKDHPHQKSAWFSHGDVIVEGIAPKLKVGAVTGFDFWSETPVAGKIVCVQVGTPKIDKNHGQVATRNEWRAPDGTKLLDEARVIHFYHFGDASLFVFDIDLHASVAALTFGDTKEGSFGIRINDAIREEKGGKGKLENAEGKVGEKEVWGGQSAWCDYSGPIDGKVVGLAILDDPGNSPKACWHSRGYGLMAANPFGRNVSGFPAMKDKTDLVKLAKDAHLKLRYGILLHSGDAKTGKVAQFYEEFVKLKEPAKGLGMKSVTLEGKDLLLSRVLEAVKSQTGIDVRLDVAEDPKIELSLHNLPFWRSLDEIARAANLRVSLFERGARIALVPGPFHQAPTCYNGPFRVVLKKISTLRDLETKAHSSVARLEIAWQPPIQPFLLQAWLETFVVQDHTGRNLQMPSLHKQTSGAGDERLATEIDVSLPSVPRGVSHLGLFKGKLNMVGSAEMLTFTFNNLKADRQEREGVVVEIVDAKVIARENRCEAAVRLKYPPSSFSFESYQINDWLQRNKAWLISKSSSGSRIGSDLGPIDDRDASDTVIRYHWKDDPDKKIALGTDLTKWKLEYTTPGPVIEVPIDFEFKDVPLP